LRSERKTTPEQGLAVTGVAIAKATSAHQKARLVPRLHRCHALIGRSDDETEIVFRAIESRQKVAQRDESRVAAHEGGTGWDFIQVCGELPGAGIDLLS